MDLKYNLNELNEDSVQCLFFTSVQNNDIYSNEHFWTGFCHKINETIKTLSEGHIWHRDDFKVNVPFNSDRSLSELPFHLISVTCFGENIEDEWFIVYLVIEITKIYTDLIVQIKDNDGDFILIEAADYLPQWANPDTTVNRVYFHKGQIHLIPIASVNLDKHISVHDAIKILVESPEKTQIASAIQNAVMQRIGNYPQKIQENNHQAVVNIPAELAALLTLEPNLVAPIVSAYYNHDPLEAKICRNIHINDCIQAKVKFTKCLYSMLVHSKLVDNVFCKKNATTETVIGLKLTFGFYIILKASQNIFSTKAFTNFLRNLKDKGYFKGNIEDSEEYNKLLEKAKNYFVSNECPINLHVCEKMKQLMSTDKFAEVKDTLIANNGELILTGDSDDWLNIHPEHLDDILNKRYGKQVKFKANDIVTAQTITDELSNFMNKSSDYEGIETNNYETSFTNNIEFEADKFSECIEKFLNLLLSNSTEIDVTEDSSEDEEEYCYGKINDNSDDEALDKEIKTNLALGNNFEKHENVLKNMIQSMKEENSSTGPSSILLKSVGINKSDILDSDDDDE